MPYCCFSRTWWAYRNGTKVPCLGESTVEEIVDTEEEAVEFCRDWNDCHDEGELSLKCEFTEGEDAP